MVPTELSLGLTAVDKEEKESKNNSKYLGHKHLDGWCCHFKDGERFGSHGGGGHPEVALHMLSLRCILNIQVEMLRGR